MKTRDGNEYATSRGFPTELAKHTDVFQALPESPEKLRLRTQVLNYSKKNVLYIVIMYKQIIYDFAAKCLTKVRDSKNYSDL